MRLFFLSVFVENVKLKVENDTILPFAVDKWPWEVYSNGVDFFGESPKGGTICTPPPSCMT